MDTLDDLKSRLQGEVTVAPAELAAASHDASLFTVSPKVVVFPRHTTDLIALVEWVKNSSPQASLTARSGGTDMTGGPLTESVVVDMRRSFTRIGPVGDSHITVQPGAWYRDLEAALTPHHLLLPSYPASKDICTVGGMVANNSGGEKSLTYGKTANYVQELKVVLSDAKEYTLKAVSQTELDQKMQQSDFEGEVYRSMFALLEKNYARLQAAKPKVSKNSAGYALWDVWDPTKQIFDLTRLFVGSQGTLGLIADITFRLVSPKPHTQMLVIFMRDVSLLAAIVKTVLTYAPETFESYDDHTLKLAIQFLPGLWKKLKTRNLLSLLISFLPEVRLILTGGLPKLVLLAEFTGFNPSEIEKQARATQAALKNFPVKTRLITNPVEAEKYWIIRRESFNLLRQHVHHKHAAPFIDDIVVRPQDLPQFLPELRAIMQPYQLTYTIAGHVGDGNFHIIPLLNTSRPDFLPTIEKLSEQVYDLVLKFGGSITGEHNDGLIRSRFLKKMFGEDIYQLFVETKKIFDPQNIFNPGKKVGSDWEFAKAHLDKKLSPT